MVRMFAASAGVGKHNQPKTVHPFRVIHQPGQPALTTITSDARQRILDAFTQSLLEQPYERMSVSNLLRRAGVGRTTFYAQFRDKEALFEISALGLGDAMARAALAEPGPWGFLRPFLHHVDSHRSIYNGFVGRESASVLQRHMQRLFARLLADDLTRRGRPIPDAAHEAALVGALWGLMVAWIERRIALGPEALAQQAAVMLEALAAS
jgi:AcrR family transcriptional regulator